MSSAWNTPPPTYDPSFEAYAAERWLTEGVISRRLVAWALDLILIGILVAVAWTLLFTFGLLTLGLGFPLLGLLPLIPFFYHWLFLAGVHSATPGQRALGLVVCRAEDLGPATALRALISVIVYYFTLATSGLLLLIALVTERHRTLHDLCSGLVVVRTRALTEGPATWNIPGGSPYR